MYCKYENGGFSFNIGNRYFVQLLKAKNNLSITSILSEAEADNFNDFKSLIKLSSLEIVLNRGTNNSYSTIELTHSRKYSNSNFDFLQVNEKKEILDIAITFILDLSEFKEKIYRKNKASH